jgi:hypothetical protein
MEGHTNCWETITFTNPGSCSSCFSLSPLPGNIGYPRSPWIIDLEYSLLELIGVGFHSESQHCVVKVPLSTKLMACDFSG